MEKRIAGRPIERETFQNLSILGANEIGFEVFSPGGGQLYVDNAFATAPVPELATFVLSGIGSAVLVLFVVRTRRFGSVIALGTML